MWRQIETGFNLPVAYPSHRGSPATLPNWPSEVLHESGHLYKIMLGSYIWNKDSSDFDVSFPCLFGFWFWPLPNFKIWAPSGAKLPAASAKSPRLAPLPWLCPWGSQEVFSKKLTITTPVKMAFFFFFLILFDTERESMSRGRSRGEGRSRGRERSSSLLSREPNTGLHLWTPGSQLQWKAEA